MKRVALRRKPKSDPVTPELRDRVMSRDSWESFRRTKSAYPCVAGFLSPGASAMCFGPLTLDHVKDEPRMGKRAPSDDRHLVTLCRYHHIDSEWATSHRPLLRWYLRNTYENPGPSATEVSK